VMVEGDINLRQYTKGDGTGGAAVTLNIQDLKLAGGQPQGQQQHQQAANQTQRQPAQQKNNQQRSQAHPNGSGGYPETVDDFDDSIPF